MGEIFTYHQVANESLDGITVSIKKFVEDMAMLQGKDLVYLSDFDYNNPNQYVITFDDGFKSLLTHALPILKEFAVPFEIFIVEKYFIEAQNGSSEFLNEEDLMKLIGHGARLQYHGMSHIRLDKIEDYALLRKEIKCPDYIRQLDDKGFQFFAYPFWAYNDRVVEVARRYYWGALTREDLGCNTPYTLGRTMKKEKENVA